MLEAVGELVARDSRPRSSSHSSRPGSTLPERVAITSPSSGVKPIVVSTERPSRIAHSDAPAPRWQLTSRRPAARRAEQLGRAPGDPGVREAVEAVAADAPALAPRRGQRVGRRGRAAASRGRRCRSTRPPARRAARAVTGVERGERLRLVQRRQRRVSSRSARLDARRRSRTGAREALAAVDDPVADRVGVAQAVVERARRARRRRSRRRARRARAPPSVVVAAPSSAQLEAARAGVDDEDAQRAVLERAARRRVRPGPVAHLGRVVAVLARVGAVAQARVDHLLAQRARRARRGPGTRSITSITRWKRSRSLSITMSNGVVVVPSSL